MATKDLGQIVHQGMTISYQCNVVWEKGKCTTEGTGISMSHRASVDTKAWDALESSSSRSQLFVAVPTPKDIWMINSIFQQDQRMAPGISRGPKSCNLRGHCTLLRQLVPGDENEEEL